MSVRACVRVCVDTVITVYLTESKKFVRDCKEREREREREREGARAHTHVLAIGGCVIYSLHTHVCYFK